MLPFRYVPASITTTAIREELSSLLTALQEHATLAEAKARLARKIASLPESAIGPTYTEEEDQYTDGGDY